MAAMIDNILKDCNNNQETFRDYSKYITNEVSQQPLVIQNVGNITAERASLSISTRFLAGVQLYHEIEFS